MNNDKNITIEKYLGNKKLWRFLLENRHKVGEVEIKQIIWEKYSVKLNEGKKDWKSSLVTTLEFAKYLRSFVKGARYNFMGVNYQYNEDDRTKHKVFLFTQKEENLNKLEIFAYFNFNEIN